jgi:hypothetical protein
MISKDRHPSRWSSGNSPLFWGVFLALLRKRRELDPSVDGPLFERAMDLTQVPGCPGLWNRNKDRPDLNAHDNRIGAAAGSALLGGRHARELMDWACGSGFTFDNESRMTPGSGGRFKDYLKGLERKARSCDLRLPGVVAFYRIAAGTYNAADEAGVSSWLLLDAAGSDESGKLMCFCMTQVLILRGACGCAVRHWEGKSDIPGVLRSYFGPDHPLTRWSILERSHG